MKQNKRVKIEINETKTGRKLGGQVDRWIGGYRKG